ncbi:hypothetical protein ACFOHS_12205 [Jhaorihella thermophila]
MRELFDLGLEAELDMIGVRTRQYGFYSKHGKTIWEEPRGQWAGYDWPQFSVHRGKLQLVMFSALVGRADLNHVRTGARAVGYETRADGATLLLENGERVEGSLVIAADGIHSALRAQMYPDEGEPIWNGRILWRATTEAPALFFGGGAMVMIGHDSLRFVAYPISDPDPETGIATINWIAEKAVPAGCRLEKKEDWNRQADINDFLPLFDDWRFDWIDVPALIEGADVVYEYPMVDRDPLPRWTDGRVTLMGGCRPSDLSRGVERGEPGDHRRPRDRRQAAGAWTHPPPRWKPMRPKSARSPPPWALPTARAAGRTPCCNGSRTAAAARSIPSTT